MIHLAFRNLFQRKSRTSLTVAAIAIQVAFVLLIIGLTNGTLQEVGDRIENTNSDLIILPPGGQAILAMSSAVMPLEPVRATLEATPGVDVATPVVIATTTQLSGYGLVFGIEPDSYRRAGRGSFELLDGEPMQGPDDLIVDRRLARSKHLSVGDRVRLLNHDFLIAGIIREGAGVRIYLPITTLQHLLGRAGKASAFFVRTHTPELAARVLDSLKRGPAFRGYKLIATSEYSELLGNTAFGVREFIAAVSVMAVVFGFLIISVVMYTMIIERTRQIGILKSLGAGRSFIARAFVLEALFLSVAGLPVGVAIAQLVRQVLRQAYPTLIILFTADWVGYASLVAVAAALLGAIYPAVRAAWVDPVVALGYE